jgi:CheY-like chemotaxis protein
MIAKQLSMVTTKKKSILFIDDDEIFVNITKPTLQRSGFKVVAAYSGTEALKKVAKSDFDLIILDINMPDMMGDEVARKIREKKIEIPIIMVTGYVDLQQSIDTLDLGVHEILLKPLSASELIQSINHAFGS